MLTPVVPSRPLLWPSVIPAIQSALHTEELYLVGGAVRDAYLHLPIHDIDLATPHDGRPVAREIANIFNGAYYTLDSRRGVGRALIPWQGTQLTVDVAQFRGPDLLTDLKKRDFTLNALAVDLRGNLDAVFDPLGGMGDLDAKRLRQCSPEAISSDPVRALRAVRACVTFGLLIESATRQSIRDNVSLLATASPERVRDEFFLIMDSSDPATALDVAFRIGLLEHIIPEVAAMHVTEQGAPHQFDVWRHTLMTIRHLHALIATLTGSRDENLTANIRTGAVAWAFSALRPYLKTHLSTIWPNHRSHRALLILAALFHDTGKPATRSVEPDGRMRFLGHEQVGEQIALKRSAALRLSRAESQRLATIVRHHMRPHHLHAVETLTPRAIYRFWRDTGNAGTDICLLALADYLGTYGAALDSQDWVTYIQTLRLLLDRYYLDRSISVDPPPLLTGQDLLRHFHLQPGPQVGELLERVREAQIDRQISTSKEALDWVQRFFEDH